VTEHVNVQFVGFEAKALVPEYRFLVGQPLNERCEFTLTLAV
jgi:hypothetical protein